MISENSVASEEIVINAPAEIVWDVLMDFANYELWNSFCPKMKGEPVVGSALEMQVDLGNGLQEQVGSLGHTSDDRHRCAGEPGRREIGCGAGGDGKEQFVVLPIPQRAS